METNKQDYSKYIVPVAIGGAILYAVTKAGNIVDAVTSPFKETDPKTAAETAKNASSLKNKYTDPKTNPFDPNFFTIVKPDISALCKKYKQATYYVIPQISAVNYAVHFHHLTTGTFSKFTTSQDNIMDIYGRCKTKLDIYAISAQYSNLYKLNLYNQTLLALNDTNKARLNAFIDNLPLISFNAKVDYPLYKV
jgi:hypothetical protein